MDRSQHFYHHRGFEAPPPFPHFMDTLDLNLHLAPPPSMESTPPYPTPFRSSAATNMFNFRTPTSVPTPQPVWTRFFLDLDNPSPSPPSPGEVEYGYHHHHDFSQSPFWGMDFSDIDSGQPLDLDLSPLLHEHLFRDDEETGFHFHHHQQHQHQQQQPHAQQEDEHVGWWRSRSSTTTTTAAASEAPQADAAAEMKSQNSSLEFAKTKNPACSSEVPVADSSQDEQAVKNSDQTGKEFFFDCNVCFDIATEPVVTSCGHLFCWPCLYQWLHVHSHNDECPVCKGAVTDADVIPIYGRGAASKAVGEASDAAGCVPPRPRGRRVQVQHGAGADVVLSEMLRWRRAMRFMHDNVERMFQGGEPGQPSRRPSRRRLMRTDGALPVTPRMTTGGVESVHQHWPAGFSPEGPVFNPPEPPAYNVVHGGMRRIM